MFTGPRPLTDEERELGNRYLTVFNDVMWNDSVVDSDADKYECWIISYKEWVE
jgi:hypothetical protein